MRVGQMDRVANQGARFELPYEQSFEAALWKPAAGRRDLEDAEMARVVVKTTQDDCT